LTRLDGVDIQLNTLDRPERGLEGMYLTVLGTSAESGDGGQVGRGNGVTGVRSLNRPAGNEAAAGKNAVSHVGKIYNLLGHEMAADICRSLDAVDEAYVWLCSQIGRPVDIPWFVSVGVVLAPDAVLSDVESEIRELIGRHLESLPSFTQRLLRGELAVC
jgi:S-adenosylmethionine synthetase